VSIREQRLATVPNEPHYMRDLAIGLQQQARILGKAGQARDACAVATRGLALWSTQKARGQISKHDDAKEMPQMKALADQYCGK
jgi:hypothetical protein